MFKIKKFIYLIIILIISSFFISNKINYKKAEKESLNIVKNISSTDSQTNLDENTLVEKVNPIFSYSSIPNDIRKKMLCLSMPENEPISFDNLSYLKLSHYDFYGNVQIGEMIVDKRVAPEVIDIFKEVFDKKYPIDKIRLIDEYNAVDNLSMINNNSSSFCYRTIANTNIISNHGKGLAIDINPFQNPHVVSDNVNPKEAYVFADRLNIQMGMIIEGDDLYNAFTKRGWNWGGHWNNPDYQHFEKKLN